MIDHVAIAGGGFAGALHAINLHRFGGPRATIVERRPVPGRGLAFGAAHPIHLLNVPAARMSAFPDQPNHFVDWLEQRGFSGAGAAFVPRLLYGDYVGELLQRAVAQSAGRVRIERGTVEDLELGDSCKLLLSGGTAIHADAAVLAVGNLAPAPVPHLHPESLPADGYVADPWRANVAAGLTNDDTVLIVGTGLTMVDMALLLQEGGFRGKIVALSRRGLVPHAHGATGAPADPLTEPPRGPASQLVRQVRNRAAQIGWREAVDELRPFTQGMWRSATSADRRRFLKHLRPWWDVHRHRIAPEIAAAIQRMRDEGRLQVVAGKALEFIPNRGVEVRWRPRGTGRAESLHVRRIINCTGPHGDLRRSDDPLLRRLAEVGLIRPDEHRIGIDIDASSRTVNAAGTPNQRLFALGPMTRGAFWEIVAVPDIRVQACSLARHLSGTPAR